MKSSHQANPRATRLLGVLACIAIWLVGLTTWAGDLDDQMSATPVKAAYLFRISQYVDWPLTALPTDTSPITIAVLNDDKLATELVRITQGRAVNNRSIVVKLLNDGDSVPPAQILFIADQDTQHVKQTLDTVSTRAILTVTDTPVGLDIGSVINFVSVGQHLRFEISLDAAERNGLKLSSRLLAVAQRVRGKVQ